MLGWDDQYTQKECCSLFFLFPWDLKLSVPKTRILLASSIKYDEQLKAQLKLAWLNWKHHNRQETQNGKQRKLLWNMWMFQTFLNMWMWTGFSQSLTPGTLNIWVTQLFLGRWEGGKIYQDSVPAILNGVMWLTARLLKIEDQSNKRNFRFFASF